MKKVSEMTPQELAEASAEAMWRDDHATQALGIKLDHVAPGAATLSMSITQAMSNGHGTCHGGYIFTLADSAFAFACNSYNAVEVAQHCSISFVHPVSIGDRLTAVATEVIRRRRSGIYDIRVSNQEGVAVAEFRGHSRMIASPRIPE